MVEFTSEPPYIKQIAIYLNQKKYQEAHNLSKQFVEKFPNLMISHLLLAKSAFWLNDFETAKDESLKAFNLSNGQAELTVSGILLACTYYRLREFQKGMDLIILLNTELPGRENIAKLKFVFALSLHNEDAALRYLDMLYEINEKAAEKFLTRFEV